MSNASDNMDDTTMTAAERAAMESGMATMYDGDRARADGRPSWPASMRLLERFVDRTPMSQDEMVLLATALGSRHMPDMDGGRWKVNTMQQDVMCFMRAMEQVIGDTPGLRDTILRKHLIAEEAKELCDAIDAGDFVEAVDGCVDLMYVVIGSLCAWGVEMQLPWNEVHKSNMEKSGHRKDDRGKVLKPEGWTPPRIGMILKAYGWEGEEG